MGIRLTRLQQASVLPFLSTKGHPFQITPSDGVRRAVHKIDQQAYGRISIPEDVLTGASRDEYIRSSLMEEAIASSQFEGAAVTREVAREMLRTERPPITRDELMIRNNYRAMTRIREVKDAPLSPGLVLELHRIVTEDTLQPGQAGTLRRNNEIAVYDPHGDLVHQPPDFRELPERLERLCTFANGETLDEHFVHPVVKAILLHYVLAYGLDLDPREEGPRPVCAVVPVRRDRRR